MIDALRFVRGAVATKDYIPELKHFAIQYGHVRGFNGVLALSSPIDLDIQCAPRAVPMVQAISNCGDKVSMRLTDSGRLSITSGKFRAFIECLELDDLPTQAPKGEPIDLDGAALLRAIEKLSPFVGNDASRMWTNGILLRDHSAFATNNICLVEYWLGINVPQPLNIPMAAIKEIQRVGQPPTHLQADGQNSLTVHYKDGRWLRTQLYGTDWPDLQPILDRAHDAKPVPAEFFEALGVLKPFVEKTDLVWFRDGAMHTSQADGMGASYDVPGLHHEGTYKRGMLALLEGAAERVDFAAYPEPLAFFGDKLRGVILGQRP